MCARCLNDALLAGRHYGFAVHTYPITVDEISEVEDPGVKP